MLVAQDLVDDLAHIEARSGVDVLGLVAASI